MTDPAISHTVERLSAFQALAAQLQIPVADVDAAVQRRRQKWAKDEGVGGHLTPRERAEARDSGAFVEIIRQMAGQHAGCATVHCLMCRLVRDAVVYVLASFRHQLERHGR